MGAAGGSPNGIEMPRGEGGGVPVPNIYYYVSLALGVLVEVDHFPPPLPKNLPNRTFA